MKRPLSIVNAPYPFPHESAASWIRRVCHQHDTSYRSLTTALVIRPLRDPVWSGERDLVYRFGEGTCVPPKRLWELAGVFNVIRTRESLKRLLFYDELGAPAYRYCPDCFASDPTPYLRIGWRLKDWTICPVHFTSMLETCPECGAHVEAVTTRRNAARRKLAAVDQCTACKFTLHKGTHTRTRLVTGNFTAQLSLQQSIISALKSGTIMAKGVEAPLPVEFLLWYRDNNPVIVKYRDQWLASWYKKKKGYILREFRRRLNHTYKSQMDKNGHHEFDPLHPWSYPEYNPIDFVRFYRDNPDIPEKILETVRDAVEQQKYSYFMPNIIFAFRTIGNRKLTINYLTKKVEPRIQSAGLGPPPWEKFIIKKLAL